MAKHKQTFSDQLRHAVETCGRSRYAIAKETGIDAATLCRFVQGGGMSFPALDKLAEYLRLRIVVDEPSTRRKREQR